MPRLQPGPGYMTSKQAQERLGVSDTLLRKYVKEGRINRYGPIGQKNKPFYKEEEIEAFYHARQVYEEVRVNVGPSTFGVAEEKDMPAILDIDTRTFEEGAAASFEVCLSWFRRNQQTFFVVKDSKEIVKGYASFLPMDKTFIEQFIHGELSGEDIDPSMIKPFVSGEALHVYVMSIATDPRCTIAEKRRYGQRLISGLLTFLLDLANEGVEIVSITARSHKKDGIELLEKVGFTKLRSPIPGHELFVVNVLESGISFFMQYTEKLNKWKEEHEAA